jgi:hypothetical protein
VVLGGINVGDAGANMLLNDRMGLLRRQGRGVVSRPDGGWREEEDLGPLLRDDDGDEQQQVREYKEWEGQGCRMGVSRLSAWVARRDVLERMMDE